MRSIYITSVERYSGKTAICLAIGTRLQADGFRVGYFKPLSLKPLRVSGKLVDEDVSFMMDTLNLKFDPWDLSPIVVTPEFLRFYLEGNGEKNLLDKVKSALQSVSQNQDIMLLEGGASLREGHAVGLPTPEVARALNSQVLTIVKYRGDIRVLDDALSSYARLREALIGIIINRVPGDAMDFVNKLAIPHLEKQGIRVFGVIPDVSSLAALSVKEIVEVLGAQVITETTKLDGLVESLTVGAMTVETALHRFREYTNKAVITGGDRTDLQLAALETSTACLILTGNLQPNPWIIKQAEAFGVPILLVRPNTMETVEAIEKVFGKSSFAQPTKLAEFEKLFKQNVNIDLLYQALDLRK